ncbi:hypothetical protein DV735_g2266, partial [Chaetothyriales sp. CBS 134920]
MPKRKQTGAETAPETPSKRPRRQLSNLQDSDLAQQSPLKPLATPEKTNRSPGKNNLTPGSGHDRSGSETPKPNGKTLFATPRKPATRTAETPSKTRADQSAKRKSAAILAASLTGDDWDGGNALAEAILEAEDEQQPADATPVTTPKRGRGRPKGSKNKRLPTAEGENALAEAILEAEDEQQTADATPVTTPKRGRGRPKGAKNKRLQTPEGEDALVESEAEDEQQTADATPLTTPKRGRGRPKGSRNKRSPTPEGDIAPEERYFFQNRTGPVHISDNIFSSVKLLAHDEYFEQAKVGGSGHEREHDYLMKLHRRSFPQWKLEMSEGYSVCLYGYGSKRILTTQFAEWLHAHSNPAPQIVIVNGYTAKVTIRSILNTIASVVVTSEESLKLSGQPQEVLDTLLAYLSRRSSHHNRPVVVMVNSIDASSLSRNGVQDVLARLASHGHVQVLVTADTPYFPLLWNSSQLDLFNFAFHDCTTFTPYHNAELPVVDEVYDLLGRKGRRIGGKDGIKYVLKSLPPNAQNLYRILLAEILSILADDQAATGNAAAADEEVGIEYRLLYQKASEEFVASSDMNFRFLLKEFHDHQMVTSRRDASGTELLCVPLGREEMQAVLEDLVVS